MTQYVVFHHERPVSREYATWAEAELFLLFETPGTPHYRVRPVTTRQLAPLPDTFPTTLDHTDTEC